MEGEKGDELVALLSAVAELAIDGLHTDGEDHKQSAIFEILKLVEVKASFYYEKFGGNIGRIA